MTQIDDGNDNEGAGHSRGDPLRGLSQLVVERVVSTCPEGAAVNDESLSLSAVRGPPGGSGPQAVACLACSQAARLPILAIFLEESGPILGRF